jgi:MYXO-CTERM domain-containing protein
LVAKTDPSYCYGDNNYKESNQRGTSENRCPYSGNTQDSTGIRTATLVSSTTPPPEPGPEPDQAPAPLPLFGAGLAFGWSRRIRRRVKRGSALAPIAVVG